MTDQESTEEPDWKELEKLVAMIQQQLSPRATVKHNVMLDGVESETKRQIDVLVEQNVGQYKMRIVIDCKDYSKPIDVKAVEEFHGLVQDVKAQKGALVCPSGFTKSALRRAKKLQIDLYRPVSTGKHKWKADVRAPVLCDFRSCYISFGVSTVAPKPFRLEMDFFNLPIRDESGNELGSCIDTALSKWNAGEYPSDPGEYERVAIFGDQKVFIDNGYGEDIEVELTAGIRVQADLYLGHLPIDDISGLKDEHTGFVVTNAFTTGVIDPEEVSKNWQKVDDIEDLEFQPIFTITGLYCYDIGT